MDEVFSEILNSCKRVLVVEDDSARILVFKKLLVGYIADFSDNASEAIELLAKEKYDALFLDHDLGNRMYVDSNDPNTGYQLAKHIAEKELDFKIFVHSLNPAGVDNIVSVLPNAIRLPFTRIYKSYLRACKLE